MTKSETTGTGRTRDWLPAVLLVALTVLAAHFARLPQFGLYEDDYWGIAPHLHEPLGRLWDRLLSNFTHWPTGRPLNHFLPAALGSLGSRLGGLRGVYAVAAAWLALNGALVYLILRQITSEVGAVVAALAYVVFPADSTKILLLHAAHVQGAMTFLLVGILLWMRGGTTRLASYPVAALALLSYETAFLPFLVLPLIRASDRRATLRTWTVHLIACAAILTVIAVVRLRTGDVRAIEAAHETGRSAHRILTSLIIGPRTSGRMLFAAVATGWRRIDLYAALACVLTVLGFLTVARRARPAGSPLSSGVAARWPAWLAPETDRPYSIPWWWLLASALVAWSASYALTLSDFSYPPTQTVGRLTSTHVAAAWPVCLMVAALYEGARRWGRAGARTATVAFAVWLASMVAYHHFIQREYARTWTMEKAFWRQVMTLAPEAGPGWTVIVDGVQAEASTVICANSWADYHVFRLIFTPGLEAGGAAFSHLGYLGGPSVVRFQRVDDRVEWRPRYWGGPIERIDEERLVLLRDDHGILHRVREIQTPAGPLTAPDSPPVASRAVWPSTPVARLLFPDRYP